MHMVRVAVVRWMKTTRVKEHKRFCIMKLFWMVVNWGKFPWEIVLDKGGDKTIFLTIWSKQKKVFCLKQTLKRGNNIFLISISGASQE